MVRVVVHKGVREEGGGGEERQRQRQRQIERVIEKILGLVLEKWQRFLS